MITIHAATASKSFNKDSKAQTHRAAVVTKLSEALPSNPKHKGTVIETEVNFIFHYRISVPGHCPSLLSAV